VTKTGWLSKWVREKNKKEEGRAFGKKPGENPF
jgi:hypothetical protein